MDVLVLFNAPTLPPDDQDFASEAGVLESVEAVAAALSRAGHRVRQAPAGDSPAELLLKLEMGGDADAIVNLCEGFGGLPAAEPHVAGLLELTGAAYTGSPPDCLSLVRNKARTKWLLRGAGLPTADFLLVGRGASLDRRAAEGLLRLGPAIVKPASEDASLGLGPDSVVADLPALERQVRLVHNRYGEALVEQFISGREFNVGILALPVPTALPLAEIEFQTDPSLRWPIVTYDAKWATGSGADQATPVRCPAEVDADLAARIQGIGLRAFHLTGCRDYARVDIRVDQAGQPFILEVNANPDLGPSAGLARAVRAAGIEYDAFIARLVETAVSRRGA